MSTGQRLNLIFTKEYLACLKPGTHNETEQLKYSHKRNTLAIINIKCFFFSPAPTPISHSYFELVRSDITSIFLLLDYLVEMESKSLNRHQLLLVLCTVSQELKAIWLHKQNA